MKTILIIIAIVFALLFMGLMQGHTNEVGGWIMGLWSALCLRVILKQPTQSN